jgi:translation initiation factor 2B subunit (eIF-2B alpha/beta/delta family)
MIVDAVREKSNAAISAPENALSYEAAVEMGIAGNASEEQLALVAPRWDCIAPEAIDAIYTNAGAVSPMGVWRLVEETY